MIQASLFIVDVPALALILQIKGQAFRLLELSSAFFCKPVITMEVFKNLPTSSGFGRPGVRFIFSTFLKLFCLQSKPYIYKVCCPKVSVFLVAVSKPVSLARFERMWLPSLKFDYNYWQIPSNLKWVAAKSVASSSVSSHCVDVPRRL